MSATASLRLTRITAENLATVCNALATINAGLYDARIVTKAPWQLIWRPRNPAVDWSIPDVGFLIQRGYGACGELASAYAGYLKHRQRPAIVRVVEMGPNEYHAVCDTWVAGRPKVTTIDPRNAALHRRSIDQ